MIGVLVFCSLLALAANANAKNDDKCLDDGKPVNKKCQLSKIINGQVTCFTVEGEGDTAYTRAKADGQCKERLGVEAHLANVYSEENYKDLRCLIIRKTTPFRIGNKEVLTGMRYKDNNFLFYNETLWPEAATYRGKDSIDLSYGDNLVLYANKEYSKSQLYKYGDENERFKLFLCEYTFIR